MTTYATRAEIPEQYRWDLSSIFASDEEFLAALDAAKAYPAQNAAYQGKVSTDPQQLLEFLRMTDQMDIELGKLVTYVKECEGVLHERKYTDYSRVVITLSALGIDARDVGGYDLLKPLGDYDKTIWQGLNGPIWALIALDSANYPVPRNEEAETQATRQMYIDCILDAELDEGGWTLSRRTAACPPCRSRLPTGPAAPPRTLPEALSSLGGDATRRRGVVGGPLSVLVSGVKATTPPNPRPLES